MIFPSFNLVVSPLCFFFHLICLIIISFLATQTDLHASFWHTVNRGLNIFIFSHSEPLQGNFHPYMFLFIVLNSQSSPLPSTLGMKAGLSGPHSQLCLNLDVECNEPGNKELPGPATPTL